VRSYDFSTTRSEFGWSLKRLVEPISELRSCRLESEGFGSEMWPE